MLCSGTACRQHPPVGCPILTKPPGTCPAIRPMGDRDSQAGSPLCALNPTATSSGAQSSKESAGSVNVPRPSAESLPSERLSHRSHGHSLPVHNNCSSGGCIWSRGMVKFGRGSRRQRWMPGGRPVVDQDHVWLLDEVWTNRSGTCPPASPTGRMDFT